MISRRDFLKVAGASAFVVATAGMMTGCSTPSAMPVEVKKTFVNATTIEDGKEFTVDVLSDGEVVAKKVKLAIKRGEGSLFVVVENDEACVTGVSKFFLEQGYMQAALNTVSSNFSYLYAHTRSVCGDVTCEPMNGNYKGRNDRAVGFLAEDTEATLYFSYTYVDADEKPVIQNFKMSIPAVEE